MKRIIISVVALALLCLPAGCTYTPHTKTESTIISCNKGETLHVDTKVRLGVITIQVTAPDGTVCFEKELSNSFDCGINIYSSGEYTVTERWENARGDVKVYLSPTVKEDFE